MNGEGIVSSTIKDWYSKVTMPERIRSTIQNYLSLDSTIDSIKDLLIWGISKEQLRGILNKDEFQEYTSTDRYKAPLKRCEEENLI